MKKLILILFLITSFVQAQDCELFTYLNQYRNANGKESVKWSTKLSKISENQTTLMYNKDSVFHFNQNVYECVLKGINVTPTMEDKDKFAQFLMKNFNKEYRDPADTQNDHEVEKYILYYTIYLWDKEPLHKAIMLMDNVKEGSIHLFIKSVKFKSNKITVGNKVMEHKRIISHYECEWYSTLNLK